jgi:transglycosylase-like protein with SLT domain
MILDTINAIGSSVTGAIKQAADATGAGFSYLLATAKIESGLKPDVKASTSSATGLFQFIDQTWLQTMKESGTELGLGRYADAIEKTTSGHFVVRDPAMRATILNLRNDPGTNAAMAGALTRQNAARLRARIGRDATEGELYIAHFLGAGGASKLINAAASNPQAKAAAMFPRAAAANRSIFYDKQGGARSVAGVYSTLVTKLARAMPEGDATQVAAAAPTSSNPFASLFSPSRTASVKPNVPMPPLAPSVASQMFAQSRAPRPVHASMPATPPVAPAAAPEGPMLAFAQEGSGFYDLFATQGRGAVSNAVSELWGARASTPPQAIPAVTPAAASNATSQSQARGFDLFSSSGPQS